MHGNERLQNQADSKAVRQADPAHTNPPPARLEFLDGLRGIAAFFVVLHHAVGELPAQELKRPLASATAFFHQHGHDSVGVFIVLSGFSLMLPVVRSADGRLRGGIWEYLKRRAKRILPPYYATLALALAMIALVPAMRERTGVHWDTALPALEVNAIVSHLFLVHNFHPHTAYRIDPPMWSVATEWQIYFLFPAFLWIWRRFGISFAVASGFVIGFLIGFLTGSALNPTRHSLAALINPWYAGLFTLGMLAAVLTDPNYRRSAHWGDRHLGFFAIGIVLIALFAPPVMQSDAFVGVMAAGLIAYCVRAVVRGDAPGDRPRVLRLLESAPAVTLGGFSYSLYLTHFPLLSLAHAALRGLGLGPDVRLLVLLLVVSPLCVAAAWVFYLAFERPFLSKSARLAAPSAWLWRSANRPAAGDGHGAERVLSLS